MLSKINRKKIDVALEKAANDTPQMISLERAFPDAAELKNLKQFEEPAKIEEIIKNNINVQYALATYVMSGAPEKSHVIGFIPDVSVIDQVAVSKEIFAEVTAYGIRDKIIGLYVKRPSEAAIQTFKKMQTEKSLNKWLSQLVIPEADDVAEKVSYECVKEENPDVSVEELRDEVGEFAQDEFVKYLRSNERNRLTNKAARAGGTLEEIRNTQFVKLLSEVVGSVYIYTEEESGADSGNKRYVKYITWVEAGQKSKNAFPIGLGLFIIAVGITYLESFWYVLGLIIFALIVARIDLKCIALKKEQLGEESEAWGKFRKKKIIAYGIACGLILYTFCMQVWALFQ